jgi:predicted ATPase
MPDSTFIHRVILENYKSIAACDVELGALTFLVGPNGSGKSNFLDALRFLAEGLSNSLDHAVRDRGGIAEVRRRSGGHPRHFGVKLCFRLNGKQGEYSFRIGARQRGEYHVQQERFFTGGTHFNVRDGQVVDASEERMPPASADRLYLVNAAGIPSFRPAYDALSHMGFYNLNPDVIRDLQSPDSGDLLERDGANLASVIARLSKQDSSAKSRIEQYLGKIAHEVSEVDAKSIGPKETLEFRQKVAGQQHPWRFMAGNMSDGTLRALGVLTSLFQAGNGVRGSIPLIGIEEPEAALHPAASGVLLDALCDASENLQILVTSHSPDLLDSERIRPEQILAVISRDGETGIAPVDEETRGVLRDQLYSAGELLRMEQLQPDPAALERAGQARLFE